MGHEDYIIEYKGNLCIPAFLQMNTALSYESKMELAREAFIMFIDDEVTRDISGDDYEGRISTKGKMAYLGSFRGQVYNIDLESDVGREFFSILLHDCSRRNHKEAGALN